MNGKIVLCIAVIFVGQAMSAATSSTLEVEDLKKVADQMQQTFLSISNHIMGMSPTSSDAQKSIEKIKTMVENEANKMKDIVRKNADPKLVEKYDEIEKELKKHLTNAKDIFDEKVGNKIEMKKITENVIKATKDMEVTVNKAIDGIKKQ